jgi:hypothetical protein
MPSAAVAPLIAALLLPASTFAQAPYESEEPKASATAEKVGSSPSDYAAIGFDAVILRPLGTVAVLVGAVAFIPAALITAPNGRDSIETAWKSFVADPARDAFQRPLGDF